MKKLNFLILIILTAGSMLIIGCTGSAVGVGGSPYYRQGPVESAPPPWAPAHGYRAKYTYRYYPSYQLYYDINRNLFFYFSGGQWIVQHRSPVQIYSRPVESVILYMMTDRPYHHHQHVLKYYPPGQEKKIGRGRR